jgi:hypothetical protein
LKKREAKIPNDLRRLLPLLPKLPKLPKLPIAANFLPEEKYNSFSP